jgi:Fe-S-cluster containining protein
MMSETAPENLCNNCVGACCRADAKLTMALDSNEVQNLEAVGTVLIEFLPAEEGEDWSDRRYFRENAADQRKFIRRAARRLNPGQGIYGLRSDCGFLEETEDGASICSVHEDPGLKPAVCGDGFQPGSRRCLKTREKVVLKMREEDSLLPDLVGVVLGRTALRTFSPTL